MSIKIVLSLLALSGLAGIALGYVLRLLIALGQRGSLELEVKQKMLEAKERAARIIAEAEARVEDLEKEVTEPLKEREDRLEKYVSRLTKREEFLDEREEHLAEFSDQVKARENEAANLKKEAEELIRERHTELARIAGLTPEAALERLTAELEKRHENALLARIQKLETHGKERMEEKARAILLTTIQRLGNAVNSEVMTLSVALP